MVPNDLYSAKPTFRGFRGQALYILSRIINDTEEFIYRPEGKEDLDICFENKLKELVQVKFYTNDLKLSDLKPEKRSSFLRRSIEIFKDGLNPQIHLVSFGPIGPELDNAFKSDCNDRSKIKTKLRNKGYKDDEIELIFNKIKIIKVNEDELKKDIISYLKTKHTGSDPCNSFNLLMNWIYMISEEAEIIDKDSLIAKLNNIATFLSETYNFLKQYELTVKTIKPTEKIQNIEKLEEEFYKGISARYEHILANLDVKRPEKLNEIQKKIDNDNNVVIIHGASGQGKSTLAYRFLHEHYPSTLTYQIISKDRDALPIIKTFHAISKSIDDNIAIYIDVEPGDTVWPEIVKELYRYPKFHIFVTIREEDWTRSTLSGADLILSEVELSLNEEEAEHIYDKLTSKKPDRQFLDFEDSWLKFGGQGPLLEFIYLITQGSTLKEKLETQIDRIQNESTETERLDFLRIVSIIGMYGGKTDLKSLKTKIKLKYLDQVIKFFQKEYLIRESGNGRYIEPLHPIRSKILVEILSDPVLTPIVDDIATCISVIDEKDIGIFLLNCFLDYGAEEKILEKLNSFKPLTWTGYGLIIKSLLWIEIKNYVNINRQIIDEAHQEFGSGWTIALFTDLSDAMSENQPDFLDNDLISDDVKEKIRSLRKRLQNKKFIYNFLKPWLEKSHIPSKKIEVDIDWMYAGFSLFWLSNLGINKKLYFSDSDFEKSFDLVSLESIADFILGLYFFEPKNLIIKKYRGRIVDRFKKELLVPSIEDDGKKITLHCIITVTDSERLKDSKNFANEKIMERINLIRKLYPERETFASKGYGHNVSFLKLDYDDTQKGIPIKNLPLDWLIEINANFIGLVDYQYRPDSWEIYVNDVVKTQEDSLNLIKKLLKNLKKYFKTRKVVDISELNNLSSEWDNLAKNLEVTLFPKTAVDPWGFSSENREQKFMDNVKKSNPEIIGSVNLKKFSNYKKFYMDFISHLRNFLNQGTNVVPLQCLSKGMKSKDIGKIKKELVTKGVRTDLNRLSVINLFIAYENLLKFQIEFNNHFQKYAQSINVYKNESTIYGTLAEVWRIFALNNFELNQNIIKNAKNTFINGKKNISRDILTILEKENLKVNLITKSFENFNENFFIFDIANSSQLDETLVKVINSLNEEFNGLEWTNLKKLLLDLEFPYFRIIILVKSKLLFPLSFHYPLFRALTLREGAIDIIDLQPHSIENKLDKLNIEKWSDFIPEMLEIQKALKCEELQQLVYHLKQLDSLELDDLGIEITKEYLTKIQEKISSDFQEILDFITFVTNRIQSKIDSSNEIGEVVSPEIKSELNKLFNLAKKSYEFVFPEKPDNSLEVKLNIKLDSMGDWYDRLEKSKKCIYELYYYYSDQLISEYESTGLS